MATRNPARLRAGIATTYPDRYGWHVISVSLLILVASLLLQGCVHSTTRLPARFESDRIFVDAAGPDGQRVAFYTDTGGGYNTIARSVAERYALASRGTVASENGEDALVVFPQFAENSGIPRPAVERWLQGNLVVLTDAELEAGGLLGSRWFEGGVRDFDYGRKTLSTLAGVYPKSGFEKTSLGFRHDANGLRDLNFPRFTVTIDGQPLHMLLDTGATAKPTESSSTAWGLPSGSLVGISYIVHSTFELWRTRNPGWRVIEQGETVTGHAVPMIEVPTVEVAGIVVGPVWFAQRTDDTFRIWMSQITDQRIEGAIGGSAFRHMRMILDYPAATAYFRQLPNN